MSGTYAIPKWLVWLAGSQIALHAVVGILAIAKWLS